MLKAFTTLNGKLKEVQIEHVGKELETRTKNYFWIDATEPNVSELHELSKIAKIPIEDLNMCLDEEERPRIEQTEGYQLIIYRAPYVHREKSDIEILTSPIGIFLTKECTITVHLHHTRYLEDVVERGVPVDAPPAFTSRV
ncbi:MAG: hypothetical protein HZB67_05740, partial [Candidatus Aenigmarchaeota archaeon]|nr:hypothetical protein [Candidatus Aenigmarchaeota archaeon]